MAQAADILLVEPSVADADRVRRALKQQHARDSVLVLGDSGEAVEYLLRSGRYANQPVALPPKVILLDLWTPFADGCDVLRRIRTNAATHATPVVVLSTSPNDWDVLRCYQLGASSYLAKPAQPEQLAKVIYEVARYWMATGGPGLGTAP